MTREKMAIVTYEQWNKAIISYFFEECEPGQIVFLQTNKETLDEIAERSNFNVSDAADSLKMAVWHKAVIRDAINFWAMNPTLWKDYSKEEPPQVAFLALTVFAASLMESEGSVAANNYYSRLNEVLFGQIVKGTPQGFDRPKFEYFWKHLQGWAIDQHSVVLYLTEGSSKQRYVWYPISQCLISQHDRRDVYRFFRNHNLTPFSQVPDKQLEKDFLNWSRSFRFAKIERYFSNASYRKSILNQIKSLLLHWDGEIPPEPPRGERQTTALVNVELRFDLLDNVEIRYWFPRRGRDKINCKTNFLGIQHLQPSHLEKWFRPIIDSSSTFWDLQNRLQLQTDEPNPIVYTLGFSDIWVFREDPERDDSWLSRRNMQLYEDHLIVFRKRLASQVMDRLRQTCEQEIEEASLIYVNGKENDWLYLRVKPIKSVPFPDQKFWKLSVVSGKRLSLIGGLSVRDSDGRRAYLDICLPTVFVPNLGLSDQDPLQVDGQKFPLDENRFVKLSDTLGPGTYHLTYGGQTRELKVISLERSLEHRKQTLIATIPEDQTVMPTYSIKEIAEVSEKFGLWLSGAKFLGTDIPKVSWEDVEKIPEPSTLKNNQSFKVPANIISSVVRIAIDFKQGKVSVPEWFDEVIEHLDQNVALRSIVQKKLKCYNKKALSYTELYEHAKSKQLWKQNPT